VKEPEWLLLEVVLAVHERLLAEFGGPAGIRDTGLLESALAKPVNLYAHQSSTTLCELAASYAFGIVRYHPFLDGNKRCGFAAAAMFLELERQASERFRSRRRHPNPGAGCRGDERSAIRDLARAQLAKRLRAALRARSREGLISLAATGLLTDTRVRTAA